MMGNDGQVRVVDVADVGEANLLVHDQTDAGLAFQLSRLSHGPYEPTPIGVFRNIDRPEYADMVGQQLAAGRARRARATSRPCSTPAPPGRSSSEHTSTRSPTGRPAGRPVRARGQARSRKTMPVRGLGKKKVLFGGMRSPPWAISRIWPTVTGRSSTPAWASPLATAARTWSTPCW